MMQFRLAARRLVRAPLFSLGVVAMLSLTLTAVTLVMSVVYATKLRPLPITDPASLIAIWQDDDTRSDTPLQDVVPGEILEAWRARQASFSDITAFYSRRTRVTDKQVRTIEATIVDGHYFITLGLRPMLGRGILPTDAADGAPPVAVLSEAAWRGDHAADPGIVGTVIRLDHQAYTIVGVLPATANVFGTPLWASAPGRAAWPRDGSYYLIGRLRPGRTMAGAQEELATLMPRTAATTTTEASHIGAWLVPMAESLRGMSGTAVLFIAATLLLALVAIANIGTLFLVRVLGKLRQTAISTAIGATTGRLRAEAALEGALLGALAGVLAVGGAAWLRIMLQSFISGMVTSSSEPLPLPWLLLAAAMLVATGTGVAIALGAHATTRRVDIASYLHGTGTGGTRQQARWRLLLVGMQVTVALIACVAAARLIASARYVSHIDVGFETDQLVVGQLPIWASPMGTDDGAQQLVARLAPAIANTPGLGEPAIWTTIGFRMPKGPDDPAIAIDGSTENLSLHCRWSTCPSGVAPISENTFAVLGIPLRRGRVFTAADRGGPLVAIVNEQAQHAWFHDADPIGRRIQIRGSDSVEEWRTIVGVVANSSQLNEMGRVPQMYDAKAVQPLVYEPLTQARLHQAGLLATYPLMVPSGRASRSPAQSRPCAVASSPSFLTPIRRQCRR